jgi:hypothetical protein
MKNKYEIIVLNDSYHVDNGKIFVRGLQTNDSVSSRGLFGPFLTRWGAKRHIKNREASWSKDGEHTVLESF